MGVAVDRIRLSSIVLNTTSIDSIVSLRQTEYKKKYGADVDLSGLTWNGVDQNSDHFGAWIDGKLVSTIRLTLATQPKTFESIMLLPATAPFAVLPCAILARAATAGPFAGKGLGMALRTLAYYSWLQRSLDGEYIYGTARSNSKRLDRLKALGYEVISIDTPWSGYLQSGPAGASAFRMERSKLQAKLPELTREFLLLPQFDVEPLKPG